MLCEVLLLNEYVAKEVMYGLKDSSRADAFNATRLEEL